MSYYFFQLKMIPTHHCCASNILQHLHVHVSVAFRSKRVSFEDSVPLVNTCKQLFSPKWAWWSFFYSMYLKKMLHSIIYPNLKNFSLFNFKIFFWNHFYNLDFSVSLGACRCWKFPIIPLASLFGNMTLSCYHNENTNISLLIIPFWKYWLPLTQG